MNFISSSKYLPKVSIIIAVYNAVECIDKCLDSIIHQDYLNYELIIIDGGSSDGTKEIVYKYIHNIKYFISEPDKGIYNAWNKGISNSCGEWFCFLGADDYFINNISLSNIMSCTNYTDVNYVCGQVCKVDYKGMKIRLEGKPWNINTIWKGMTIAHPGSLHHISLFNIYGFFDESYLITGDYEFLLRCSSSIKSKFLKEPYLYVGNEGISNTKTLLCIKETVKVLKIYSNFISLTWVRFWLLETLKYYFLKIFLFRIKLLIYNYK
jgi:glycosyltransferase involved in cell wall biosynthesis